MWTELMEGTSSVCSVICWVALTFLFIYLAVIGVCLIAMFCEDATQKRQKKKQAVLRPLARTWN
jgi:cell division protein FtsB